MLTSPHMTTREKCAFRVLLALWVMFWPTVVWSIGQVI